MKTILGYLLVIFIGLGSINAKVLAFAQSPRSAMQEQASHHAMAESTDHTAMAHDCCEQSTPDDQGCCEGCDNQGCASHCLSLSAIANTFFLALQRHAGGIQNAPAELSIHLTSTLYRPPRA
ncbi:hypothetical protein P2G88_14845 [Aliiglaciecola sp. CAU 1673]|uniref:hypothetical protein n=1 Tax=Aliiglaciecola sp. CAU 1673 TaxID=3032595 RepID=UPI0023DA82D5|nr:hypothetical protein [Aliiglaciecola sp. CAU 1673]MDF2179528.1 hypothetical protein [Aliiglaciecola sp. CAU 1673]